MRRQVKRTKTNLLPHEFMKENSNEFQRFGNRPLHGEICQESVPGIETDEDDVLGLAEVR